MLSPKTGSLRDWTLDNLSRRFGARSDLLILLEAKVRSKYSTAIYVIDLLPAILKSSNPFLASV